MIMNDILNIIKKSNTFAVAFHVSPDGDSLGSSLALTLGLRKLNKKVYILSKEQISADFGYLPNFAEICEKNENVPQDVECLIVLDSGDFNRINARIDLENKHYSIVNIDHHISNSLYGDLNYVNPNSSAVGEIVYQMLKMLGVQIDKDIASSLYTSLVCDTGSFRYSNTTSVTHSIAGDLINTGIDFSEIHRIVFENKKFLRLKLYGLVLEKMKLIHNKICVMYLTKDMLNTLGMDSVTDTSDIISFGMKIDSAEVAILFKESEDGVKVSLRSKHIVDVSKIAEVYGGGGHVRASGISIKGTSIDKIEDDIIRTVEKELVLE